MQSWFILYSIFFCGCDHTPWPSAFCELLFWRVSMIDVFYKSILWKLFDLFLQTEKVVVRWWTACYRCCQLSWNIKMKPVISVPPNRMTRRTFHCGFSESLKVFWKCGGVDGKSMPCLGYFLHIKVGQKQYNLEYSFSNVTSIITNVFLLQGQWALLCDVVCCCALVSGSVVELMALTEVLASAPRWQSSINYLLW